MNLKWTLWVLIFLTCMNLVAQEREFTKFEKGIFNALSKDSTWAIKLSGRLQVLATSTWPETQKNQSNFLIRRARLKVEGFAYSPKLRYEMQLGVSNSDIAGGSEFTGNSSRFIQDAVIKWNFHDGFELWFGQMKLPGNREFIISSGSMQMVDRSILSSNFSIDRDLGIQLHHQFILSQRFIVKEIVSISQGEGRNIVSGNLGGHQYTARLELLPFGNFEGNGDYSGGDLKRESAPKLAVAAAYDFNNNAVKTKSNQGSYMVNDVGFYETDITTVFIDAMFKFQGFSLMAEYTNRSADDPYAKNSDLTLTGDNVKEGRALNFQSGYLFKNNWEISARYTNLLLNNTTVKNIEDQYTLGVSKYLVGHKLKIQSDISHLESKDGQNELTWRVQFNINF